jgi:hypothetical protein
LTIKTIVWIPGLKGAIQNLGNAFPDYSNPEDEDIDVIEAKWSSILG